MAVLSLGVEREYSIVILPPRDTGDGYGSHWMVCVSVYLHFLFLFICLFIYLFICLFVLLSVCYEFVYV